MLILESDIIYNVLPYVDFKTISNIFCVSKLVNNLCNDKHFWKNKFMNDYKNVIAKSDNWLCEYKNIMLINIHTIKFVEHFLKTVDGYNKTYPASMAYIFKIYGIIECPHLYEIFDNPKINNTKHSIFFGIHDNTISNFYMGFRTYTCIGTTRKFLNFNYEKCLSKENFIKCITILRYNDDNYIINDIYSNKFTFSEFTNTKNFYIQPINANLC